MGLEPSPMGTNGRLAKRAHESQTEGAASLQHLALATEDRRGLKGHEGFDQDIYKLGLLSRALKLAVYLSTTPEYQVLMLPSLKCGAGLSTKLNKIIESMSVLREIVSLKVVLMGVPLKKCFLLKLRVSGIWV